MFFSHQEAGAEAAEAAAAAAAERALTPVKSWLVVCLLREQRSVRVAATTTAKQKHSWCLGTAARGWAGADAKSRSDG